MTSHDSPLPISQPDPTARADYDWSSPEGIERLRTLLSAKLPYDPADFQVEDTARLLMGKHVLCVTATGDGKSALFYMYSLVRPDTMTIVVSPTNALEADMVQTLERLGISAVAINRDALDADAVQRARHPDASTSTLWDDVESEKYNLVLLSPEMLESARFKACGSSTSLVLPSTSTRLS